MALVGDLNSSVTSASITLKKSHLLKIDVIGQLHVLGVDAENLESSNCIGNSNVDLTIEAAYNIFIGILPTSP